MSTHPALPVDLTTIGYLLSDCVVGVLQRLHTELADCFATTEVKDVAGRLVDLTTNADGPIQDQMIQTIRGMLPGVGIIAEEARCRLPCGLEDVSAEITIDPLDGSKQLAWGNPDGAGSMLALVVDGQIQVAAVGHLGGQVVYAFAGNGPVRKVLIKNAKTEPVTRTAPPIGRSYLLLDENPLAFPPFVQQLCRSSRWHEPGPYYDIRVDHGGISSLSAKLWGGQNAALLLSPRSDGVDQPWDILPVVGLSEALGYQLYLVDRALSQLRPTTAAAFVTPEQPRHDYLLISHPEHREALKPWL